MSQKRIARQYERADSISHAQYVLADSAYRCQVTQSDSLLTRAETAEGKLAPVAAERDRLKGRTWAGRTLRKARDKLAILGGAYTAYLVLRLVL